MTIVYQNMSSPYVINTSGGAEPCTAEKCEPFFIREWETVLVGTLIVAAIMYLMCSCGADYFSAAKPQIASLANTQRNFTVNDLVGPIEHTNESFVGASHRSERSQFRMPAFDTKNINFGQVAKGLGWESTGPSVSKFMDFGKVDEVDVMEKSDPESAHTPSTSDAVLESLIR